MSDDQMEVSESSSDGFSSRPIALRRSHMRDFGHSIRTINETLRPKKRFQFVIKKERITTSLFFILMLASFALLILQPGKMIAMVFGLTAAGWIMSKHYGRDWANGEDNQWN